MQSTKPFRVGAAARILAALLAVAAMPTVHAAGFTNGNFAGPVSNGWNPHGYKRSYLTQGGVKDTALPPITPQQLADLMLSEEDTGSFVSQSATTQGSGTVANTAGAIAPNLPLTYPSNVLRVHDDSAGGRNTKASSVSQEITLEAGDFDPRDNKVHVRFQGAPVLEYYATHNGTNQAYFFIEIIRNEGTPAAVRSYTTYNFAGQPGVVFQTAGNYRYTAWTDFDIVVPDAVVGDKVTLRVVAAGCGDTAHAGAFYMHEVRTGGNGANSSPVPGLWIAIDDYPGAVKQYTNPDGSTDIEYTYRYTNTGGTNLTGVVAQPDLPVTSGGDPTTFVGFTKQPDPGFPNAGTCTGTTSADMSCAIGDLKPGETGTFKLKVRVPAGTSATVNNGNYPISANGVPPQSGQLVQTKLQADMVPDTSQLPPLPYNVPVPTSATFSCKNMGSTAATNAQCTIANLPTGVSAGTCMKTDINGASPAPWTQGASVGVGETVTCGLTGQPTDPAQASTPPQAKVTGTSDNDGDPANNISPPVLPVRGPHVTIDLSKLPKGTVGQPYTGSFTCTSDGQVDAYGAQCGVTGLPTGLTVGQCKIGPAPGANWNPGDTIPHTAPGNVVTCPVTGTPTQPSGPVKGTAGTDDVHSPSGTGTDAGNSVTLPANSVVTVSAPASIPTLSEWGLIILSALMGLFMFGMGRRRMF